MELAGFQVARWVRQQGLTGRILVLTGPGSNGGDGWVAARHLASHASIRVVSDGVPRFPGADEVVRAAQRAGVQVVGYDHPLDAGLDSVTLVIDAVFGVGFHGTRDRHPAFRWLQAVAERRLPVVAVDLVSGTDTDTGQYAGPALNVMATVTFGATKWGHVGYPAAGLTGSLVVADIGLAPAPGSGRWIDPQTAHDWIRPSRVLDHKYRRGHVVVIGGSRAMPGAPQLAGWASLKAGAGLVELLMPAQAGIHLEVPELIVHRLDDTAEGDLKVSPLLMDRARKADAVVIGPGIGQRVSPELLWRILALGRPTVIDADALRLVPTMPPNLLARPEVVLTPHAGELGRLLGRSAADVNQDRRQSVIEVQSRWGATCLLKGYRTLIAGSTDIWVNPSGQTELATAGSGDVLSGVIGALLAQGYPGPVAAALGAYWHGIAGDVIRPRLGHGATSRDIIAALPEAWRTIEEEGVPEGLPRYWK